MKIAYLVKAFPRLSETFILNELLELERRGHELTVFSRHRPAEPAPAAMLDGLQAGVHQLASLLRSRSWEAFAAHQRAGLCAGQGGAGELLEEAVSRRSGAEMRYWLLAARVAEILVEGRFDLIHAHFASGSSSVARYASRLCGIPYTLTAHAKDIYAHDLDPARLTAVLEDAAAVVTVADANVRHLARVAPRARVVRIYNGLPLDEFSFLPAAPAPSPPRALFVGRLVEKKGVADLLEAAAILRAGGLGLRCRIVGSGPLEADLRREADRLALGDTVEWCGPATRQEILDEHLPAATLFALPAVVAADGDRDGLPTTLIEAMARGVPVVSTRVTGIPEIVDEGRAGGLVAPGDVPALARAIAALSKDPQLAETRRRRGRQRVESLFDATETACRLEATFREAVEHDLPRQVRA